MLPLNCLSQSECSTVRRISTYSGDISHKQRAAINILTAKHPRRAKCRVL